MNWCDMIYFLFGWNVLPEFLEIVQVSSRAWHTTGILTQIEEWPKYNVPKGRVSGVPAWQSWWSHPDRCPSETCRCCRGNGGCSRGSAYFLGRFAPSILLTVLSICRTRLCRFPVGTRRRRGLYCGRQRSLQCLAGAAMCGHGILQFFAITSGFQLVLCQWNMRINSKII